MNLWQWILNNEFLTMSLWECNVSFCRQATAEAGNGSRSPTLLLVGGYYQELMKQYEPTTNHYRLLPALTRSWYYRHLLILMYVLMLPSYSGLLAPAFVAYHINVAQVVQATSAQVERGTSRSPYFPAIVGKSLLSIHFSSSPTITVMVVILERKEALPPTHTHTTP